MAPADHPRILTINAGSSSLKAALYDMNPAERLMLAVEVERIGRSDSQMRITDGDRVTLLDRTADLDDHETAVRAFLEWLQHHGPDGVPDAVGHRVVHGGRAHRTPRVLTADVLTDLQMLVAIDPDHLPQALASRRRRHRPVLLPRAQVRGSARRRARWAPHADLHRRNRRTRGPRP